MTDPTIILQVEATADAEVIRATEKEEI